MLIFDTMTQYDPLAQNESVEIGLLCVKLSILYLFMLQMSGYLTIRPFFLSHPNIVIAGFKGRSEVKV